MSSGYLDIHSHILPSVDDGSKDMEMTMKMVEAAYAQGVRTMIATPHYYPGHKNCSGRALQTIYQKTAEDVQARYNDFTLLLGNEIYYKEEVADLLKAGEIHSLAGTRYVLLEFPVAVDYKYLYGGVRKCVNAGFYPVLAHMERYRCLYKEEKKVSGLVHLGAYMQVNAENFRKGLFQPIKNYCMGLLQKGLVHFLASDCHNLDSRRPDLGPAADYLAHKLDPAILEKIMYDNPAKLLQGDYLQ